MSKIGTYNLELQDKAMELGYDSTQEMLAHKDKLEFDYEYVDHQIESLLKEQATIRKKLHKIRNAICEAL